MPVNDVTTNRSYQKPNIANTLSDDVGRLRSALDSIDTDMASKAPSAGPTFTGVTTVAAGSAAAPSLTFTGATSDTGLYSPGADQLAISTAGTGRLFVDASGRVGIGTSAPIYLLHTQVSNNTAYTSTSASLLVPANTLNYVANSDNTTANTGAFTAWAASGTGFSSVWYAGVDGGTGSYTGPFVIGRRTGSISYAEVLRIDSSGRVGIGVTDPGSYNSAAANLVIGSTTANTGLTIRSGATGVADRAGSIYFADGTTGNEAFRGFIDYTHSIDTLGIGTSGLTRLVIDSSGRLLVGTSSSSSTATREASLQLFSDALAPNLISALNTRADQYGPGIVLAKSRGGVAPTVQANDALGTIIFSGHDGTDLNSAGAYISAAVDGAVSNDDLPTRLVFSTTADGASSPTERMRISQDGAVKIAGDNFQIATSKTPASATAAGTTGQIAWDANYIYVCTATNTWKRTAIATW